MNNFDYIIVGSGAAGSVLAERLSRDPHKTVLVLEAGGSDRNPIHLVPKGFYFTMNNRKFSKFFQTEPYGDGNVDTWHRGSIIGGSTTVNGLVWNRGWAPAYDAWEEAGNKGWNWQRFLDAFRALEKHELGGSTVRGGYGPVDITVAKPREEVSDALVMSLGRLGVSYTEDMNSTGDDRVGYVTSNVKRGTRVSAARAFLRGARRRKNVTVLDRTEVARITFTGTRASGVEANSRGRKVSFTANKEVLVCAGSLESPLLLERSGIGAPEVLRAAGVPVLVESPKVGENLREHRGILLQFRLKGTAGFNQQINSAVKQLWTGFKYLFTRDGVISYGGYNLVAMYKSDPASPGPDTQSFFTPISTSGVNPTTGRMVVDKFSGGMFLTFPMFPTSAGSIHITGPAVTDTPRIIPNFLATEHDRQLMAKAVAKAREIAATKPFADYLEAEVAPGPTLTDDADIADYAINNGGTGYHTLGTCAIGPDDDDVVDGRLRVRGTTGLRVVDASVFPAMPSGNNNAPTQAMAWIAAELIAEDNR
ncbi:GMC family oxidoreductase [Rhodococcus sp. NPDC057014]|uniref:GMC family oxidoreductase n=1 Tax=Rhodococcus sp. NPDC057014 TaxID=3346000 RepID=UPI00363D060B